MSDLDQRERAQLGLQYIEDAIVNLLVRHTAGLGSGEIAARLGLSETVMPAILGDLVKAERILGGPGDTYLDNPRRY